MIERVVGIVSTLRQHQRHGFRAQHHSAAWFGNSLGVLQGTEGTKDNSKIDGAVGNARREDAKSFILRMSCCSQSDKAASDQVKTHIVHDRRQMS